MITRFTREELDAVAEVLASEELSSFYKHPYGGKWVQKFEKAFAEYIGVQHAISVSNGTTALHTVYKALGIGRGDEVITSSYTFVATVSMILECGAKAVFVDVDPETYNLDPEKVEKAVTPYTKAIVPVHLLGQPCDMKPIMEIAEKHGLYVIEDACQALGAEYKAKKTGTLAHAAVFSFQNTKQMTTLGEGGMIVTDDPWLADRCCLFRNNGAKYFKDPYILGYNYRMTEAQAAVGYVQLKKLDMFNEAQIENARYIMERLPEALTPPHVMPNVKHIFYIIGCLFNPEKAGMSRDKFLNAVSKMGLNKLKPGSTVGAGYTELVYQLPYFRKHRWKWRGRCRNAEKLIEQAVWFDWNRYPHTEKDMDRLLEGFNKILRGKS